MYFIVSSLLQSSALYPPEKKWTALFYYQKMSFKLQQIRHLSTPHETPNKSCAQKGVLATAPWLQFKCNLRHVVSPLPLVLRAPAQQPISARRTPNSSQSQPANLHVFTYFTAAVLVPQWYMTWSSFCSIQQWIHLMIWRTLENYQWWCFIDTLKQLLYLFGSQLIYTGVWFLVKSV